MLIMKVNKSHRVVRLKILSFYIEKGITKFQVADNM